MTRVKETDKLVVIRRGSAGSWAQSPIAPMGAGDRPLNLQEPRSISHWPLGALQTGSIEIGAKGGRHARYT